MAKSEDLLLRLHPVNAEQRREALECPRAHALFAAAIDGDLSATESLLHEGVSTGVRDSTGETPLHAACLFNHYTIAHCLVEHGADVSALDHSRNTPLHSSSLMDSLECLQFLLARGSDPNALNVNGNSPLMFAVRHVSVCRELLLRGASTTLESANGDTALHYAALCGDVGVVKLLLENGAVLMMPNKSGMTPKDMALRRTGEDRRQMATILRMFSNA